MKIVQEISLISMGSFEESSDWSIIQSEIRHAISLICILQVQIVLPLIQPNMEMGLSRSKKRA